MPLPAGRRLGPYEIVAPLGAGGMGEVYRARDPRLGRDVAIKVLPESVAGDAERLARFEQEARAASALSHPSILAVFDIGVEEGMAYLVTELLDGETLRERLLRGPLPVRKTLELGAEIASGLAAAHEQGIVHRDLKPENLFVTRDGRAKILDFGLARLEPGPAAGSALAAAPTMFVATSPGTVIGTVGYMAPEQVRGQAVDGRADLFSLGAVLYEMLSGKRAFARGSDADTMAAILREEPAELTSLLPELPPAVDRIVAHCLEKNAADRFDSAHDLAFALETLGGSRATSSIAAAAAGDAARPGRRTALGRIVPFAGGALAVALAFVAGSRLSSRGAAGGAPVLPHAFTRLTEETGPEFFPSLSPDGTVVGFMARRTENFPDIWIQRTGSRRATRLTADCPLPDMQPAVSPDATRIAYVSSCDDGGLFLMGIAGENRRRLARRGFHPAWFPAGDAIVYATAQFQSPDARGLLSELWRIQTASGAEERLFAGDAVQPAVSPHRRRIAYWAIPPTGSQRDIWTIPAVGLAPGESPVAVTSDPALDWNPLWSPAGDALYFLSDRSGSWNLWRVAIDEATGETRGEPQPMTLAASRVHSAAISRDGRIAYLALEAKTWIDRYPFDATAGRIVGPAERLWETARDGYFGNGSPDGRYLSWTSQTPYEDIAVVATDGSGVRQLTDDAARDRNPTISPDGRRVAFQSDRSGAWEVWTLDLDGGGLTQITHDSKTVPAQPIWLSAETLLVELDGPLGKIALTGPDAGRIQPYLDPGKEWQFTALTLDPATGALFGNLFLTGGAAPQSLAVWRVGATAPTPILAEAIYPPVPLPGGQRVLSGLKGQLGLVDVASGRFQPLPEVSAAGGPNPGIFGFWLSEDGRSLYVQRRDAQGDLWLATLPEAGSTR